MNSAPRAKHQKGRYLSSVVVHVFESGVMIDDPSRMIMSPLRGSCICNGRDSINEAINNIRSQGVK